MSGPPPRTAVDKMAGAHPQSPRNHARIRELVDQAIRHQINGMLDAAAAAYDAVLAIDPDNANAFHARGVIRMQHGDAAGALPLVERACALAPDFIGFHNTRISVLLGLGRADDAVDACQPLIETADGARDGDLWYRYALALLRANQSMRSLKALHRAMDLRPDLAPEGLDRPSATGDRSDKLATLRNAEALLDTRPDDLDLLVMLGVGHTMVGNVSRALALCDQAIRHHPTTPAPHNNKILFKHFDPDSRFTDIAADARAMEAALRGTIPDPPAAYPNAPEPDRVLKIGYMADDFRAHSNATVFSHLFGGWDRSRFQVYAYAGNARTDFLTDQFRALVTQWRDIAGMPQVAVPAVIAADEIDILVDLTGHAAGVRTGTLMMKPAPLQIGWINMVGITAVDYLITDSVMFTQADAALIPERLIALPPTALVFTTPVDAPPVAPGPLAHGGPPTFGCFNNPMKISDGLIETWARVLEAVPGARMVLKFSPFDDDGVKDFFVKRFKRLGLDPGRLTLLGHTDRYHHMAAFELVDISLDTFPGNGGATTWESLWQGVPVVTLMGDRPNGRATASVLTALEMHELIGRDVAGYVEIATGLAQERDLLAGLRATMRDRIRQCPSLVNNNYIRAIEGGYRTVWRDWCENNG